tara:strand:- start:31086 stop:32012 length:927 start_codon:yes stop_codon:yes gene_type:complete
MLKLTKYLTGRIMLQKIYTGLIKPEYILRPFQLVHRLTNKIPQNKIIELKLPWNSPFELKSSDDIGRTIFHLGFYELSLSELIWRAIEKSDSFIDVGTNIGYFTSLALANKNFNGKVTSFEPHPELIKAAKKNIDFTNKANRVDLLEYALSDQDGEATLFIPVDMENNNGLASLERPEDAIGSEIQVQVKRLDDLVSNDIKHIIKIDTEGHEASVLKGATKLLESGSLEVIFFEEHASPDEAETFKILKEYDYNILRIDRGFWGPKLSEPNSINQQKKWQPVNYVAIKNNNQKFDFLNDSSWKIISDN